MNLLADNFPLKGSLQNRISILVMKFNKLDRAKLHLMCLFKNPKGWRFYLKGVLRELGIDLSKFWK